MKIRTTDFTLVGVIAVVGIGVAGFAILHGLYHADPYEFLPAAAFMVVCALVAQLDVNNVRGSR